jgi:CheY-like chemotaxis protein
MAQTLALALHELATNAAKYGALSTPLGKLAVRWSIAQQNLALQWVEDSGRPIAKPTRSGFGSTIVTSSVEGQLRGSIDIEWRPTGFCCSIVIPLPGQKAAKPKAVEDADASDMSTESVVLVVEDEALVAMSLCEALTDLGFAIAGPFNNMEEALAASQVSDIKAAFLDVNLNGQLIYPLADELASRDIPFVFMTGYEPDSIESRFSESAVLQKPVNRTALEKLIQTRFLASLPGSKRRGMVEIDASR